MEQNLTTGSVLHNILRFSLPYLLSYFLQTLYGMADLFIIGQFEGVASTTAVSVGSQVMHMVTVMIVGLAMGATVTIGRAVGAGNRRQAANLIGNTVTLFLSGSVVVALLLLAIVQPVVHLLSVPQEAISGTILYLIICFLGVPCITAYNIISSIFRGLGDSKSPMYFIAVACVSNIALDYLFIGGLGFGAAGAALGTTLAQAVSVLLALYVILKRKAGGITLHRSDFKPNHVVLRQILDIGVPVALQDGFVQIAFMVITVIANQRGLIDAAAVGIVEKIISFLFLVPSSMLSTVSALCAQNIGAGKHSRAAQTLRYAICITAGFGVCMTVLIQFVAQPLVGSFTTDTAVAIAGAQYLHGYVLDVFFAGIHFSFSGYFCAYGKSNVSFLHNIISISCMRIPGVYLASRYFPQTLLPMGLATASGSLVSVIVCLAAYALLRRRGIIPSQDAVPRIAEGERC
ncbi:MAG: MATE family efflux transporter [Faecalibacterium sp.]